MKNYPNELLDILGISDPYTVTLDEIKKIYKKKALETHPDRGGSTENFIKIQEAYEKLKDFFTESNLDGINSNKGDLKNLSIILNIISKTKKN